MRRIHIFIACLLLHTNAALAQSYTLPAYMNDSVNPLEPFAKVADPEDLRSIHTVAVIAGLGDTLTVKKPGFFGLRTKTVDIANWNLNPLMVAAAQKWLSARFEIKTVNYDASKLGHISAQAWYDGNFARTDLAAVSHEGVDAFVAIRRAEGGLQLVADDNSNVFEVANFQIEIIDARKWRIVARHRSQILVRAGSDPSLPVQIASARLKPGDDLVLKPEQMTLVQRDFMRLLSVSLVSTIRAADLGAQLPGPEERKLVPIPREDEPYQAIKKVAVLSAIGGTFETRRFGFLVNHPNSFEITGWNLDAEVEANIKATLSARLEVKDVSVDRTVLRGAGFFDEKGKYSPHFPGLVASEDIDAYLLVVPFPLVVLEHAGPLGARDAPGVGMLRDDTKGESYVYAHCSLVLIDAKTLKMLSGQVCVSNPKNADPWPRVAVEPSLWPADDLPPSPQQDASFHKFTGELMQDVIEETLLRMGLTGKIAEDIPPLDEVAPAN